MQLSDEKPEEDPNKELQLNTSQQHKENSMAFVPHFAPMYITVIEAPDTRGISTQMTKHEKALLSEYQQREGGHVLHSMDADEDSKGWSGEKYESASVKHGNKAFHKFNKQLYACPQQCLR